MVVPVGSVVSEEIISPLSSPSIDGGTSGPGSSPSSSTTRSLPPTDGFMQRPISAEGLVDMTQLLQDAIKHGDVEQAKKAATILASHKIKLAINPSTEQASAVSEQDIKVKVFVEDMDSSVFVTMTLRPSVTVGELKKKVLLDYGFAPEVQNWIIGQRLPQDHESLARCGVRTSGASVFLYLVNAKSVGLTPEKYREKYGYLLYAKGLPGSPPDTQDEEIVRENSVSQEVVKEASTLIPASSKERNQSLKDIRLPAAADKTGDRREKAVPTRKVATPGTSKKSRPPTEDRRPTGGDIISQEGWSCPKCTYFNLPTRPGCEMCSTDRPNDYHVPENVAIPMLEQQRLEQELQLENLAREASSLRHSDRNHLQLTEEQLDQMLGLHAVFLDLRRTYGENLSPEGLKQLLRTKTPLRSEQENPRAEASTGRGKSVIEHRELLPRQPLAQQSEEEQRALYSYTGEDESLRNIGENIWQTPHGGDGDVGERPYVEIHDTGSIAYMPNMEVTTGNRYAMLGPSGLGSLEVTRSMFPANLVQGRAHRERVGTIPESVDMDAPDGHGSMDDNRYYN